jgi:hypothetical protein
MNTITSRIAARIQSAFVVRRAQLEDRRAAIAENGEEGASTLEYVGATIAAITMAMMLIALFRTGFVPHIIESFIKSMLNKFLKI